MDYIEAFKDLKTNNKYSRKSPHKAILLLTIIEMYEKNILSDNMITYDDKLRRTFLKVWNDVLKDESLFHPEAYFPFWYMQNEDFWHIVPNRGKEDILTLLRDTHVKPSEAKIKDSVKYAELDEDLYFLMTVPSGRSSLRRALLETYSNLSEEEIDKLSESQDNTVDNSISAIKEYERMTSKDQRDVKGEIKEEDNELIVQFRRINEDLQLVLNIEYFSFLKSHRSERAFLKELCPTVYDLYDRIVFHPFEQGEISPSLAIIYDNFLSDLKISLMSEDGSMDLIDKIIEAIDLLRGNNLVEKEINIEKVDPQPPISNLEKDEAPNNITDSTLDEMEIEHVYLDSHGNILETSSTDEDFNSESEIIKEDRKGKPWSENEEELITLYYKQGKDFSFIAKVIGRTEIAIKSRLAKLGLIEYTYAPQNNEVNDSSSRNFTIKNTAFSCSILNELGERVFTTDGIFKYLNGKIYRLNMKRECFTIKDMSFDGVIWSKGVKKIVAYPGTELYDIMEHSKDISDVVEDINDDPIFDNCKLKANGIWYNSHGYSFNPPQNVVKDVSGEETNNNFDEDISSQFSVKVGDKLRLFPSQIVGFVSKLRLDKRGNRIIVVKANDGSLKEVCDSRFFYEKILANETESPQKTKDRKTKSKDYLPRVSKRTNAMVGDWIKWKPTGDIGKIIDVKSIGSYLSFVLRLKGGVIKEVYNNSSAYDIVENIDEEELNDTQINIESKVIKVGDWIKVKSFNVRCKILRIEKQGPYEKLILQFEDGQQDWIINNPELYTIL